MAEPAMITQLRSLGAKQGRAVALRVPVLEAAICALMRAQDPDELRRKVGDEEVALELLREFGQDADRVKDRWDEQRRHQESGTRQVHTSFSDLDDDPRHDPRVTSAIMSGASNAQVQQILGQVSAEYAARVTARARQEARASNFMWTDQHGRQIFGDQVPVALGVGTDALGRPEQRTLSVNPAVQELGSERVDPPAMADVARQVYCTEHPGSATENYCSVCGRPRPQVPQEVSR